MITAMVLHKLTNNRVCKLEWSIPITLPLVTSLEQALWSRVVLSGAPQAGNAAWHAVAIFAASLRGGRRWSEGIEVTMAVRVWGVMLWTGAVDAALLQPHGTVRTITGSYRG